MGLMLIQSVTNIIYFSGIVIFFIALTGKPKYGLFFLVPLLPLQTITERLQQLPLGKDFNDLLIIGMVIGWCVFKSSRKEHLFDKSVFTKILFLYFIFTYISLWQGSFYLRLDAPLSFADPRVQSWKNYVLFFVLFFIAFNSIKDTKEIKKLFIAMCLTMFVMNYYVVKQISWAGSWMSRDKFFRGTFVWLGANEVAAFYATYTFVLIGILLFIKEKRLKIFLFALIGINLYCNLFLMSRAAYVATIAGFLLIGLVRKKILIVPIVIILLFWQTMLPQKVVERIKYTKQEDGQLDNSAAKRFEFWEAYLDYFKQNPIMGVGYNVAVSLYGKDTHNIYFRTMADQGIIGLGFLLSIMLLAYRRGWLLYKRAKDSFLKGLGLGYCACVVSVMVGNFFGDRWTYLQLGAYFWVFLGMVERGNLIVAQES